MLGCRLWLAVALVLTAGSAAAQRTFRDCSSCPEMVEIPAGIFTMGVSAAEEERDKVDADYRNMSLPQVRVSIGYSFALGRFEVTRGQFAAFVQATGHDAGNACSVLGRDGNSPLTTGRNWRNTGVGQSDDHPVVCVTWDDANAYAQWLTRTTGKTYRLPSEAEWEYAARAGTTTARHWGDGRDGACREANVADQSVISHYGFKSDDIYFFPCHDGHPNTSPVGRFPANAFGLHDTLGNVWEWTADCWMNSHKGALTDGSPRRTGDCAKRVVRGGSWYTNPSLLRAGNRSADPVGNRDDNSGFRVLRMN